MGVKVHDLGAVTGVIVGIPVTEGRGKVFAKISKEEDDFGTTVGADGTVVRWKVNNPLWNLEITLLNASKHQQQFSAIRIADLRSTSGAGLGVLLLEDTNGATLVSSPHCWIKKPADREIGQESGESTWEFQFEEVPGAVILGGN